MGLADFLAEAGGNTVVGHAARAAGGRSSGQRQFDTFINEELPAMAQAFEDTEPTDPAYGAKISKLGQQFIQSAARVGYTPDGAKKMLEMLVEPAKRSHASKGYGQLADEMTDKPPLASPDLEFTMPTPGETPSVMGEDPRARQQMIEAGTPRPGKPFDEAMGMRVGQIATQTGIPIPTGLSGLLRTPSAVANQQASQRKTQQAIDTETQKQATIARQSDVVPEGAQISPRDLLEIQPTAASQLYPQREMSGSAQAIKNQELAIRQSNLEALNQRREFLNQLGTANMATEGHRLELQRLNTEIRQMELELKKQGTTSETTAPPDPIKLTAAQNRLAKEIQEQGITDLPTIQKMADDMGYELITPEGGAPQVKETGAISRMTGGWVGQSAPRFQGGVRLRQKPTTRATAPTGAAPAGKPTAPAPSSEVAPVKGARLMEAPDGTRRMVPEDQINNFIVKGAKFVK